jgi:hypothetical protein
MLDACKTSQHPSADQIGLVVSYIKEEKFARYFFSNLENPNWVEPLYYEGIFFNAPSSIQIEPGTFQMPLWPAGEYLAQYAKQFEKIVIDVAQSIKTDNRNVHTILLNSLMKTCPQASSGIISCIDSWLDERFSDMLVIQLLPLANRWLDTGIVDAPLHLLESVIKPVLPPKERRSLKYASPLRFRSDHYWVNEYCKDQFSKLLNRNAVEVLGIFKRQLIQSIDLVRDELDDKTDLTIGYYWRLDIPKSTGDRGDADVIDLLIDGIRDALVLVCKQNIIVGEEILSTYLDSEYLIFRRLALFTLRSFGQNYPSLVNQSLLHKEYLYKSEYHSEYLGLMRDQFDYASEEVKTQVIAWILEGPIDLEERTMRRAQWRESETTDEIRIEIKDEWNLYHLQIIKDFLCGEALERLNQLIEQHGVPDITERPRVIVSSWEGAQSPIPGEELKEKTFDDLQQVLLTYIPEDSFRNSRGSLAQTLQALVREDLVRYQDFATYLINPEIRFVYIYHYLAGVRDNLRNNDGKLSDGIIELCKYISALKKDIHQDSSDEYEPNLRSAQLEVANLLESALRSKDPYLSKMQLDRIQSVLLTLANNPDPKNEEDDNFDAFTHSMNCVRGEAMHGIIHYSLYQVRQQDEIQNEKKKTGFLEPEIQKILEEKLDKSKEKSVAVHAVYGAYVPQLHFLSKQWLEKNLEMIFPKNAMMSRYWNAAWDAYISASNVYRDVFPLLVPQYKRGVLQLNQSLDEQNKIGSSPRERLAQHIMWAYLDGLTDFDHENELLELFFNNATDPIRASGIFWLSQVLGNNKPAVDDPVWKKCWTLWQRRLEYAEMQDISLNSQEMSNYLRWLKNCPVGMETIYQVLSKTIKYSHDGFDIRQIAEFAAENSDQYPLEAVMLLQSSILAERESWWRPKDEDEEKILRIAIASGIPDAKRIAFEVINYRGEQGDFRWKDLLE